MSNELQPTSGKAVRLIDEWRADVNRMSDQFKMALPAHIPVERFLRVVMTALQNNHKLMACSKQSFFNAAVRCAQDGLLPDGREAAIVPFGEETDDDSPRARSRADLAGYLPMIFGIRKKVRNSGEIKDLHAHAVYEGDEFAYELGDEPFIRHKPKPGGRTRPIKYVYSIAVFNDGTISRDVMPIEEVEDIRKKFSRSRKGPWSVKESYSEMAIKTVVKHHAKSLPMSTDLDRLIHADDSLYDFQGAGDKREAVKPAPRPTSLQNAFDVFAPDDEPGDKQNESLPSETDASAPLTESETESSTNQEHSAAETKTPASAAAEPERSAAGAAADSSPAAAPSNLFTDPIEAARQRGIADRNRGQQKRAVPPEYRDNQALVTAWQRGWETDK
jgi:recombination protein RecT